MDFSFSSFKHLLITFAGEVELYDESDTARGP
jgi:hypothetical protein